MRIREDRIPAVHYRQCLEAWEYTSYSALQIGRGEIPASPLPGTEYG